MAKAAALLIAALALPAVAEARGAESDPERRSLVVQAVEKASPAVVNVSTEQIVERHASPFPFPQDPFFEEFFRDFVDPRPRRFRTTSLGSGVIVAADGTIMTNVHVIERASRVRVTLNDQREFDATLVGADADADIAVLRVKAGGDLPHIPFGTSADLMIGETVIAIGNPFGLSHTVTTGVVSAVGRSLRDEERTYTDFIQTDASINPGNSGGPLLDIKGELIGINTAIYGKAQGIGFAIPVDRARRIMKDLVSYGEVRRPWVGVLVQDLTPDLAQHFGTRHGVVVADVEPKSPGAAAGLEPGGAHRRRPRRPPPRLGRHAAPHAHRAAQENDRATHRARRAPLDRARERSVQRQRPARARLIGTRATKRSKCSVASVRIARSTSAGRSSPGARTPGATLGTPAGRARRSHRRRRQRDGM